MISITTKPKSLAFLQLNNFHSSFQSPPPVFDQIHTTKLLKSHFEAGRINEAKKLFEEIPERNIFTWSTMIYGYATSEFHAESIKTFSQLRGSLTVPNSFTMVAVLVSSIGLKDAVLGQSIHGLILKFGFDSDNIVCTAMLNTYAKCGNVMDSHKIFKQMDDPGVVSCNAMIAGLTDNKLFEEALTLFNQLRRSGFVSNSITLLSVIRGCTALESAWFCRSIHGLVTKAGLCSDVSVSNVILDMYSTLEDLEGALKVFEDIEFKDIISWTTMIGLLTHLEFALDALKLFCRMKENGMKIDKLLLMNLVMACAQLGDLKIGRLIHTQAVITGYGSELLVANSVIAMYSKCGDLLSSTIEFDRITEKSLVSWTAMISGYMQNGRPKEALEFLRRMRTEEQHKLDEAILVSSLTACAELAGLEPCRQLHCYGNKIGFCHYKSVQNSLVSAYSKCGDMELADKVFKEMEHRDVVSWNAIISGFGINGRGEDSLALFREMKNTGQDPDGVTYLGVFSACSHSGLVNDGLAVFYQMLEDNKIKPSGENYGCIVDMLARAGCLSEANRFMNKLAGMAGPNVWRALLSGCRTHGNVELAKLAADRVLQLDPKESDQVVLLSNVYASNGRFEEAEVLRSNMRINGLVKEPGISVLDGIP